MRKAKIAAIIFGGVSTCLCGGILGVYSTSTVVSSASPQSDFQNIYNVESEKLADVAAVTSISTTATTTSTDFTTTIDDDSVVVDVKPVRISPEIRQSVNFDIVPAVTELVSVPAEEETITTAFVQNEDFSVNAESEEAGEAEQNETEQNETEQNETEEVATEPEKISESLTISGPFIAQQEEPEEADSSEENDVDSNEDAEPESEEDIFDFEPSTEYFPPAVEYIGTVQTTTETTSVPETITTTTTVAETSTTEESTTTYSAETTTETETETETTTTTVTETTTEETTESTETTTVSYEAETTESTETTTVTAFVITVPYTVPEEDTTTETTTTTATGSELPITEKEYILLCNTVANEAGSNWIGQYDKAKVVEVIMNRVNSPLYPNNIYDVVTQPYQFEYCERYCYLDTFSNYVTDDVKAAVELYFSEPSSFTQNYFGFYGDGYQNYFY